MAHEPIELTLNGKNQIVKSYDEDWKLLDLLREHFHLTAAKSGCSPHGQCGCCTVIVDGKAKNSCTIPIKKVNGLNVTTLEGFSEKERSVLSYSFAKAGAIQCGFCIPGIVVRTKWILDNYKEITLDLIKKQLDSHICRCTGYLKLFDAIKLASELWHGKDIPQFSDKAVIGDDTRKYDSLKMAVGERQYVSDIFLDDMIYGAFKFSPAPRAKILKIDTSEAIKQEGVIRIITGKDVPGEIVQGIIIRDWPLFIREGEITYYRGSVLALVVAQTEAQARRAAKLIKVDYEELKPILSVEDALKPDAPQIHKAGNILSRSVIKRGNVEQAFKMAKHVVKEVFQTQYIEHAFLEPESAVARMVGDKVELFSQGQGIFDDRKQIASFLNLKEDQVIVHLCPCGGGFGGKEDMSVQGHAAIATYLTKKPVKISLNREESIQVHPKRHPIRLEYEASCDENGFVTAVKAKMYGDSGAHASVGAKVLERAAGHAASAYKVENVDVEALAIYTNNIPCGAMRGFGVNQSAFAMEGIMDRFSELTGIDGWKIRYQNALSDGDRFCTGQKMHSCGLKKCLEAVKDIYYSSKYAGIAVGIKNVGIGNGMPDIGRCLLEFNNDGTIDVYVGFTEMGQGLHTLAQQIVCDELNVPPSRVRVQTSTKKEVSGGMTTASRGTVLSSNALADACNKVKNELKSGKTIEDFKGKEILGEYICDFTNALEDIVEDPITHLSYGFAAQVIILDDDGKLKKVVAAHDVGRIMNISQLIGQIEGAVHMGLGFALSEELVLEDGKPVKPTLRAMGMLKAKHMPEVECIFIEEYEKNSFYGCKGVGEIGLVPTAGAVGSAIYRYEKKHYNKLPMKESIVAKHMK